MQTLPHQRRAVFGLRAAQLRSFTTRPLSGRAIVQLAPTGATADSLRHCKSFATMRIIEMKFLSASVARCPGNCCRASGLGCLILGLTPEIGYPSCTVSELRGARAALLLVYRAWSISVGN